MLRGTKRRDCGSCRVHVPIDKSKQHVQPAPRYDRPRDLSCGALTARMCIVQEHPGRRIAAPVAQILVDVLEVIDELTGNRQMVGKLREGSELIVTLTKRQADRGRPDLEDCRHARVGCQQGPERTSPVSLQRIHFEDAGAVCSTASLKNVQNVSSRTCAAKARSASIKKASAANTSSPRGSCRSNTSSRILTNQE